jgi:hypothetical protein
LDDLSDELGDYGVFWNSDTLEGIVWARLNYATEFMVRLGCTGDLNGDSVINAADLALLLGAWGASAGNLADINADGTVDAADLALLLGSWGTCE